MSLRTVCGCSALLIKVLLAIVLWPALSRAEDWPQWRGPRRDAASLETGLLQSWPTGGPKVAWKATGIGTGYASVVVGNGRVFTLGRAGSDVIVTALDEAAGTPLWTRKIGETERHPSSTPTLDEDRLYALDPDGELVCLKAATGEKVWEKSLDKDFAGKLMSGRGYGESPLIDGERLICTPGGPEAALVALHKRTGETIWRAKVPEGGGAGRDGAGFSSVVVTEAAGLRQYVQLLGRGLVGIDAKDGRLLWSYKGIANGTANIPTPVVDQEYVFAANGYTAGSVLLKLLPDQRQELPGVTAEVVYTLTGSQFQNHHGGVVRLGDHLFAGHGNNNGLPTCLEFKTGRIVWKRRGPGIGSAAVVAAEGQLYFRYQNGVVALLEASPRGYKLNGTLQIAGAGGDSWAHPVVANGRLYLREQDTLWTYDVRKDATVAVAMAPGPASDATWAALEKLDVTVEPLSAAEPAEQKMPADKARRIYQYVLTTEKLSTHLVALSDAHLSPDGTLAEPLLALLRALPGKLILNLAGTPLTDAGLRQLQRLNPVGLNLELCTRLTETGLINLSSTETLRILVLSGTSVTAAALQSFRANKALVALDLELCDGVSDDACKALGSMSQLKLLNLKKSGFEKNRVTDAGLHALQRLTNLEVLNLYGNHVTDTGLQHLQAMTKLRELNLSLLAISNAGLKSLKPLTALEHLELLYSEGFAGPTLNDGAAEFLAPLTNLHTLNLTGAQFTDQGLQLLEPLRHLMSLQLVRTRVSAKGIEAFNLALPGCRVVKE